MTAAVPVPASTVLPGEIVRPMVDANLCAPPSANGGDDTGSTFDPHLFAWPTNAASFPIQIIGDPISGPTGPFALLQRYPEQVALSQRSTIAINDWSVAVTVGKTATALRCGTCPMEARDTSDRVAWIAMP